MRLTRTELETLRALDWACWEDSECGGQGWAFLRSVAIIRDISYAWASQLLKGLILRGMVEARWSAERTWSGYFLKQFAPTEAAADYLLELDSATPPPDRWTPVEDMFAIRQAAIDWALTPASTQQIRGER